MVGSVEENMMDDEDEDQLNDVDQCDINNANSHDKLNFNYSLAKQPPHQNLTVEQVTQKFGTLNFLPALLPLFFVSSYLVLQ